jgi:DegV family protein with EDD domain
MAQGASRRIAVITDSTADLPAELVLLYGIIVVPQTLIMGDQTWRDGVDIDSRTFYQLLAASSTFPTTSQPSAADFVQVFAKAAQNADGIVAVLISNELSGTLNSAQAAAKELPHLPIEIVDSRAASMMLGLQVLAAARAAARGEDLKAVADTARALVDRSQVLFVVDTLEYLHRGGRIGAAARLVGSALNLKPILEIKDGIVSPVTRVRTRTKALERVYQLLEKCVPAEGKVHMAVVHVASPQEAADFADELQARFRPVEILRSECGPVIGAHAGPGTVGVAFYAE